MSKLKLSSAAPRLSTRPEVDIPDADVPQVAVPVAADLSHWKALLSPDSRHRIINKINETLRRHLPYDGPEGEQHLRQIAVRFEEKVYTAATTQSDYLRKISLTMLSMATRGDPIFQNPIANSFPAAAAAAAPSDTNNR